METPWYRVNSFEHYKELYTQSTENPDKFWGDVAENFRWRKKWDSVCEWNFDEPKIEWFKGAKLNITENCLDRHLDKRGNKIALVWEPNDPKEKFIRWTYRELHDKVCRFANVLKENGCKKGDVVAIYMPMIPELTVATLACARIGAVHSVVFAGFSAHALADRINDAQATMVLTSDGLYRGLKEIPVKRVVDEALEDCTSIKKVVVVQRTNWAVNMVVNRDVWLHEELDKVDIDCPAESMNSEDMLFILYTSGSTGKPKGIVHTCGGYMVYADYSFRNVFQTDESDIFWCTADIGWVTGHTYIVYGPLLAGATTVMFEGIPTFPDAGRFWQIIDKYGVNQFYTAPTAIRALMAQGDEHVLSYSLDSLKVIGTVGEPINEEAWYWYHVHIGKERCPVVDTWWQTETGGIMISSLAGVTQDIPTYATLPLPGIQPCLMDEKGNELPEGEQEGRLCIKFPWPSMARTIYGDHQRFADTYYNTFKGNYFTGDGAKRDAEGNYRITGRVDDIVIVSGHNLGTAEIENAIDEHPLVAESAVVGYPHNIKGNSIYSFVTLKNDLGFKTEDLGLLEVEIKDLVSKTLGPICKPEKIQFTTGLPKTRSGKIMRRILRKIAEGDTSNLGDISTLLNPECVEEVIKGRVYD